MRTARTVVTGIAGLASAALLNAGHAAVNLFRSARVAEASPFFEARGDEGGPRLPEALFFRRRQ